MKKVIVHYTATKEIEMPDEFDEFISKVDEIKNTQGETAMWDYIDDNFEKQDAIVNLADNHIDCDEFYIFTENGSEIFG